MSFQIKKKMLLSKILVIIHVSLIKPKKSLSLFALVVKNEKLALKLDEWVI